MKQFTTSNLNIISWISNPYNHLKKIHNGGYVLNSGYFSGDNIPIELRKFLSQLYEKYGSIEVEITSK